MRIRINVSIDESCEVSVQDVKNIVSSVIAVCVREEIEFPGIINISIVGELKDNANIKLDTDNPDDHKITIMGKRPPDEALYSLLHELMHLVRAHNRTLGKTVEEEEEGNKRLIDSYMKIIEWIASGFRAFDLGVLRRLGDVEDSRTGDVVCERDTEDAIRLPFS